MAFLDLGTESRQRVVQFRTCRDQRGCRQIVEQRRGLVEEQRQVVLDAAVGNAFGYVPVDRRARGLAGETGPVATTEAADGSRIQRRLPGRQNLDLLQGLARQLGIGVEGAERVDLLVEQVDAVGLAR